MDELAYWLALLRAPGIGARTLPRLLDSFGDPQAFLDAGADAWEACGIAATTRTYLASPDWDAIERDLQWASGQDRQILTLKDVRYPLLLQKIADPPPVLFVHGNAQTLGGLQLAMVGSRNPSPSGEQIAYDFAKALAERGLTITSGLAIGIDGACHQGALDADGNTIGVAGTGLDRVYPARHRTLAHEIACHGALISEFPTGTPARAENFPRRNRIISGLSLGTLVVEAALRSGSLITARCATEQGREVFAVPGSIHNPLARGCHALIRQGVKLVETTEHILEELGPLALAAQEGADGVSKTQQGVAGLDEDYQRLMRVLGFDPTPVDVLMTRSGLTAEAVSSMLLILELEGFVVSVAGGRYCRVAID